MPSPIIALDGFNELRERAARSPILTKLLTMHNAGWFKFGRKASETVAKVRTGPLANVSVVEVLNELDWLRRNGFLGKRPSPHVLEQ